MSLTLDLANPSDVRNAAFMAVACELAYLPPEKGVPEFSSRLGLDASLIAIDNTQAYVAQNDTVIVVAFRGSEAPITVDGIKDWLITNANDYLIIPEGEIGSDFSAAGVGARFHRGFMAALAEVWTPLFAAVESALKSKRRPLWITGHSLGGALSVLAAWRFEQKYVEVFQVTTFGGPMVGNAAAALAFNESFEGRISRYVDQLDLVPLLPTISLTANTYEHCHAEQILVAPESSDSAKDVVGKIATETVDGVLKLTWIDDFWKSLQERVAHHMVDSYQNRIKERCESASSA
jgi:pimeloyl-ACP methyl ester carboxylesterase